MSLLNQNKVLIYIILDHLTSRKPKFSKFLQVIDNFQKEILVCFNKPEPIVKSVNKNMSINTTSIINSRMDFSLRISYKEKISFLKNRISEIIGIDVNSFIMKKYGPSGTDIKDLNSLICTISTTDLNIFLQNGTPLKEDEMILNMSYCEFDFSEFKVFPYKFTHLDNFIIKQNATVKDVKNDLRKLIEKKTGKVIENEDYLIIRECKQEKPSKVIIDLTNFRFIQMKLVSKILILLKVKIYWLKNINERN
jgi:hypothetical protein